MHFYTIQYFFKIRNELPKMFLTVNAMECDYLKRQLRGKEVCEHVLSITYTHTHTHTRTRARAHTPWLNHGQEPACWSANPGCVIYSLYVWPWANYITSISQFLL